MSFFTNIKYSLKKYCVIPNYIVFEKQDARLLTARKCNYKIFILALFIFLFVFPAVSSNYAVRLIIAFNILYFFSFLIKAVLFACGYFLNKNADYYNAIKLGDSECPIYTILIPLYKEKYKTILALLVSLYGLDYPKEKLDIKLILEEEDTDTERSVKALKSLFIFDIVIVPNSLPKTKPKACNYALQFAKGEFVTIYDAEDKPEKYQLKKAVAKFREYPTDYACLQASLNYYNKGENFLTKCFCVEYSFWFDFTLRALEKMKLFFPLGGTSNHFKTERLKQLGGWDSYNVTEDADIGVRIARTGQKIGFINSITNEEAPVAFGGWLKQRTRWIKGFMQTYCVHMRNPIKLYFDLGWKNFLIFQIFVGMSFLFFISFPFILFFTVINQNILIHSMSGFNLLLMFLSMFVSFYFVVYQNKFAEVISAIFVFPFYWFLHSLAGIRALYQIITQPFYWDKTEHGMSVIKQ